MFLKGEGITTMWVQYLALTIIAVTTMRAAIVRFPKTIGGPVMEQE